MQEKRIRRLLRLGLRLQLGHSLLWGRLVGSRLLLVLLRSLVGASPIQGPSEPPIRDPEDRLRLQLDHLLVR